MTNSNTKPILFIDFDGTICMERYWRSLPSKEHEQVQELLFRDDTTLVNEWLRGKHTAEEINKHIADNTDIEYDYLWELFVQDCKNMTVPQDILDNLNALREKYIVILITGNMDSFTRFTQPALWLDRYFDAISNSFYEGRHKTDDDGSLFMKYTEQYNSDIKDAILIDDSTKVCDVFTKLGGTSLQVSDEHPISHYLAKLQIIPFTQVSFIKLVFLI